MVVTIRPRRRYIPVKKEPLHKINEAIEAVEVRLVGDDIEQGVYPFTEALRMAENKDLDLVEVTSKSDVPVCKIIDYKKFLYNQKKKQKEIRSKAQKVVIKEIRFGPNTDEHDFDFKLKHAKKFVSEGAKIKAFVFFKGRTIIYKERGQIMLLKLAKALEEIAVVESMPKMEGKRMIMFLMPKKK